MKAFLECCILLGDYTNKICVGYPRSSLSKKTENGSEQMPRTKVGGAGDKSFITQYIEGCGVLFETGPHSV